VHWPIPIAVAVFFAAVVAMSCDQLPTDSSSPQVTGVSEQESGESVSMKSARPLPFSASGEYTFNAWAVPPTRCASTAPPFIALASGTGVGNATRLGRVESSISHCIDPADMSYSGGEGRLVVANSDELWIEYSGQAERGDLTPAGLEFSWEGPVNIVGGTGRFQNAAGELWEVGQGVLGVDPGTGLVIGGTGSSAMEGWIEYDASGRALMGSLQVTTQTSGADLDPDGYVLGLDALSLPVGANDVVVVEGLVPGQYEVDLSGAAFNCSVTTQNPVTIEVLERDQAEAQFELTCRELFQELETLGGESNAATDVNDLGQVVGWSQTAAGERHAFLWTEVGGMVDLETLGGATSQAEGINNLGQVVGSSTTTTGETHAFLWTPSGGMVDLETLGGTWSAAYDINDLGHVVGSSLVPGDNDWHAFDWSAGSGMVDLSGPCYECFAYAINEGGQAAGVNSDLPYIWGPALSSPECLGWTDQGQDAISDINGEQAVGVCSYGFHPVAVLWALSDVENPQTLPVAAGYSESLAWGLNDRGQIAGSWYSVEAGCLVPVHWTGVAGHVLPTGVADCGRARAMSNVGLVAGSIRNQAGTWENAAIWRVPVLQ